MNVQLVEQLPFNIHEIFKINSEDQFLDLAIKTFDFQYKNNDIYRKYVDLSGRKPNVISSLEDIPFLPISFFKSHNVTCTEDEKALEFHSSGTTGQVRSRHLVADPTIYQLSFLKGFELFYGPINNYIILGLLPSYMENEHSSLIYMVDHLIQHSNDKDSGFFLNDFEHLLNIIEQRKAEKKILLIGVSYALLDLAEKYQADLSGCIIMETGGMKGKRKELTKPELHKILKKGLNVDHIHSEYGMTELLSQGYSMENQLFQTPPWMKILIRQYNDPFSYASIKSGGINVIDLANIYSCSFIATQDLGKQTPQGFEVLGRFDDADLRGCNLLIQ
ncbi:MAG: acyl transferase [Crocinitomicaceae bacterium]|nr:acyl transferase [Crocinitomicaceae bacterium]